MTIDTPTPSPTEPTAGTKVTAAKAIYGAVLAALIAGLGSLGVALSDSVITPAEWVAVALATTVAIAGVGGTVYGVSNKLVPASSGNGGPA